MLTDLLQCRRILIIGGSGGVGKTSISAALGVASANAGFRTLVLTIDPARRLAASLGLDRIGPEVMDLTPKLGIDGPGELHAMMLDVKSTLDRAVERYAPNRQGQEAILANRLYQNLSTRLSGSQEFAAMQQLQEIAASDRFERIILDTPPSTQALDFLTAPERLQAFFDASLMRLFIQFGGTAGRGFLRVSDVLFRTLERLTGARVIRDIGDFFQVAESILDPFHQQARRAQALLKSAQTAFIIVTGPYPRQLADADRFRLTLGQMHITVSALIVNRWLQPRHNHPVTRQPVQASDPLGRRLAERAWAIEALAQEQTQAIDALSRQCPQPVVRLPELDIELHSLAGLQQLSEYLTRQ